MGYKGRDVEVCILDDKTCLVTACDSCGAIGSKPLDQLQVPPELVGSLTARVALIEVVCTGALPRVMTVAISSEPDPTGTGILAGIRKELALAGLPDLPLVISTEKNFTPEQTGLGIGLTGTCPLSDLRIGTTCKGDQVYCLGSPRVGEEVAAAPPSQIIGTDQIRTLLSMEGVHDILPIGSRGIGAELKGLAQQAQCHFIPLDKVGVDMVKTAGPSTCAVFTHHQHLSLDRLGELPLFRLGTMA